MIISTIRIYPHDIKNIMSLLDDAYFAIEKDLSVLKDADRPFINDPIKAQDIIHKANSILSELKDEGITEFDTLLYRLNEGVQKIRGLKVEYSVTTD